MELEKNVLKNLKLSNQTLNGEAILILDKDNPRYQI